MWKWTQAINPSVKTIKDILGTPHGIALCLGFLTFPALVLLWGRGLILNHTSLFSVTFVFELCFWICTPLLSYAFLWRPLIFAVVILRDKIHLPGRHPFYVNVPLTTSSVEIWPPVSIHLPVHTESWEIIKPTLKKAAAAVRSYNLRTWSTDSPLAKVVVSDDGLRLFLDNRLESGVAFIRAELATNRRTGVCLPEEELLIRTERHFGRLGIPEREGLQRIIFYELNDVTFIARPQHNPGFYQRRGEFPKASNLNEALRLDQAIDAYLKQYPESTPETAWKILRTESHWGKIFVSRPPRLGAFVLLLDKDSGTPEEVLTHTIPEFLADPALAYTVHPTIMENARENLVTKIISPGASLYFNYWLPFTAQSGMLMFSGHNVILRKEALQQIGLWPEDRIAEDYVASIRILQRYSPKSGVRYHGLYVYFPEIIFTERVPTRFLPFLQMIKKYTAGSFQMFLNPIYEWSRAGLWTEDVRAVLKSTALSSQEKLGTLLAFAPYLATIPLVGLNILTLHLAPSDQIPLVVTMAVAILFASNSPSWVAHWRAWRTGQDPFRIRSIPALLPVGLSIPLIIFHLGLPFHLFATAVSRLFGEKQHFTTTSSERWQGESAFHVVASIVRTVGRTQLMAVCYLILVMLYLGIPRSWTTGFRFALCVQWGIGTLLAPFFFDPHLTAAVRHIRVRSLRLKIIAPFLTSARTYTQAIAYGRQEVLLTSMFGTLLLFTLLIRIVRIDYNAPFTDESFYQMVGKHALNGGPLFYHYISGAVYIWPLVAYVVNSFSGPLGPRVVTAFFGTATVAIAYFLGKHLWLQWTPNKNKEYAHISGILSGILVSTAPSAVWISRIGTYDALSNLFLAVGTMLLILGKDNPGKRYYFYSSVCLVLSVASSYSALVCVPFLLVFAIVRAIDREERIYTVQQFVVPVAFCFFAFYMLNYPYVFEGIQGSVSNSASFSHARLGFAGTLLDGFRRMAPLLIGSAVAIVILLWPASGAKSTSLCLGRIRRPEILCYGIGAFSVVFYYLLQGHVHTMDRKLAMAALFAGPLAAVGVTQMLSALNLTTSRMRTSFPAVAIILMVGFYSYAAPIVKRDEQSYFNMNPVLDVLAKTVLPQLPEKAIIGYTSDDGNVWYLKQHLESLPGRAVYVDEASPWDGYWLGRLEAGWRPHVLVGMLSHRNQSREQQTAQSEQALVRASKVGYSLHTTVAVSDRLLGDGEVYVLLRKDQDVTYRLNMSTHIRGIAYSPTNFNPERGIYPSEHNMRDDLSLLQQAGFRGIVTYGAKAILGRIPEIARSMGFDQRIIMGIWDPFSVEEWNNALAQSLYVDVYCVGNEGLGKRYSKEQLGERMQRLRALTKKPVTTSERINLYFDARYKQWLFENSDFIFPIVHPYWGKIKIPEDAVSWTAAMFDSLVALTDKEVIFKEVGLPTGGDSCCNEKTQAEYFSLLEQTRVNFIYFEAFDQQWKSSSSFFKSVESFWGLYHADRTPKFMLNK